MIDWAQHIADENAHQAKQKAAAESGNVVTVRMERTSAGLILNIDSNHPVLFRFPDCDRDTSYTLSGGAVHSLVGHCPCGMIPIEDLAKDGETELVIDAGEGKQIVLQIPQKEIPNA